MKILKAGGVSQSKYSLAFSIIAELDEDYWVRFLLENDLSEEAFELRIKAIFGLLKAIYIENEPIEKFPELERISQVGRTLLIAFDEDKQKLVVLDPRVE